MCSLGKGEKKFVADRASYIAFGPILLSRTHIFPINRERSACMQGSYRLANKHQSNNRLALVFRADSAWAHLLPAQLWHFIFQACLFSDFGCTTFCWSGCAGLNFSKCNRTCPDSVRRKRRVWRIFHNFFFDLLLSHSAPVHPEPRVGCGMCYWQDKREQIERANESENETR